jgi:MFS family permease
VFKFLNILRNLAVENTKEILRGLRISVLEGALAHVFANLTGNIFLPAFALFLGANAFQIGLLASAQFFATLAQFPGAILVDRFTHRKRIAIYFAFLARALWLPLIVYGLFNSSDAGHEHILNLLILIVIIYHILASISGVSWLSWMSVMVPEEIRGRFFGFRNSILGIVTILVTLAGGYFLDWFQKKIPDVSYINSFFILFSIAVVAGLISAIFLTRQFEPVRQEPFKGHYLRYLTEPLQNRNFRFLLLFALFWSFAVNFAAPFYVVYMLKDLAMTYTLISILVVVSAVADLTGMGIWGHYSDQLGNRAIMVITASMAALLPFLWIFTSGHPLSVYLFIPILHLLGGFVVSGYNLTSVNLIFRSAPRQNNTIYFAFWATSNGVMAGFGALAGGYTANNITFPFLGFDPGSVFKVIFLFSSIMRVLSLIFLLKVKEEKSQPLLRVIRILRNVRSWASMMGYHPVLQFFLPARNGQKKQSPYWPIWKRNIHDDIE